MALNWNPELKVKSITVLDVAHDGTTAIIDGYRPKPKWKKIPRRWRPIEKSVRKIYKSIGKFSDTAHQRHIKSNQKKKNGWARDLVHNEIRSLRKALP
jgi:hypothetical protein